MWQGAGQPEQGKVMLVVMELGVDDNLLDIHLNLVRRVSYIIIIIIITSVPSLLPRSQSPSTTVHSPPPRAETMLLKIIWVKTSVSLIAWSRVFFGKSCFISHSPAPYPPSDLISLAEPLFYLTY